MRWMRWISLGVLGLAGIGVGALGLRNASVRLMGRQPDGKYLVSSGQTILPGTISFPGRPSDFALHPDREILAVQTNHEVFLVTPKGVLARTSCALPEDVGAGFRGIVWTKDHRGANWTPKGMRFVVSTDQGYLQEYLYEDLNIFPKEKIWLVPEDRPHQVWPGGIELSKDAKKLYVAVADLDAVCEVDIASHKKVREFPVQRLPFECRLTDDQKELIVSNWGGHTPRPGEIEGVTGAQTIVVDSHGAPGSGSVSIIRLDTGKTTNLEVGLHPTSIVTRGRSAWVANASSDTISEIDLDSEKVRRTISVHGSIALAHQPLSGAMPNALALQGNTLYCCVGGDNALAEIDLPTGQVKGYRPAGYWPISIQLSHDGRSAYVLNSKGNGSVENTNYGNPGNPHDFQGTISVIDLSKDLGAQTREVARLNRWNEDPSAPARSLAVYRGAIKHVLYIIKENQTYDSIFGDFPEGNGDSSLCVLGERAMPNHRKIARDFALFDNAYVSGTNSADGHAWSTQAVANDYMEHEYVGYRTYPDDGRCSMSIAPKGCLWDDALAHHKRVRVYGEFAAEDLARYTPYKPKNWFEAYADYRSGQHKFHYYGDTRDVSLRPYLCHDLHNDPMIQCDQSRADVFLNEYRKFSQADQVPDLMILILPNDHGAGMDPEYPTIAAMSADNDLAYGRIVDEVSHSPQWKDTAIFMIEDDGQALPDHVDGHRTAMEVVSPYVRRHGVDHNFYTTCSLLRSIELMLGLDPMNRFDALADPLVGCFQNTPNLSGYDHCANKVALDERQTPVAKLDAQGRRLAALSKKQDWSHLDAADPAIASQIAWYCLTHGREFPEQYAMRPGPDKD